jgi:hypothetical protein
MKLNIRNYRQTDNFYAMFTNFAEMAKVIMQIRCKTVRVAVGHLWVQLLKNRQNQENHTTFEKPNSKIFFF